MSSSSSPLSNIYSPQWQKITVPFASVQTAGLTNTILIYTLPAKGVVHAAKTNVTQLFSGGTIATITGSVGIAGSVGKYVAITTIATANLIAGVTPIDPDCPSTSTTTAVNLTVVSTVANLSALTQGSLDVYLLISTLP